MKRPALSAYGLTYLATVLVVLSMSLPDAIEASRLPEGDPGRKGHALGALGMALGAGLFAIPTRLLLGLFPEPSSSSLVRFVRRLVFGMICGPLPVLLVFALSGGDASKDDLVGLGLVIGLTVGLVDGVVRDQVEPAAGSEDTLAE